MLHTIDAEGNTTHVCPHCKSKNEHHIGDMEWMSDADLVGLPPCSGDGCTTRTFIKTRFSKEDLAEPIITKDEFGKISNVVIRGAPNLWPIITHLEKNPKYVEGGNEPPIIEVIDAVLQHPAIVKHQELARQLYAQQKFPLVQTTKHTDDGMLQWDCPACQEASQAHVTHPEVAHVPNQNTVALPACQCGVRVAIKIDRTEPQPVKMLVAGPDGQSALLEGVPFEQAQKAQQHQMFLSHLREAGKLL